MSDWLLAPSLEACPLEQSCSGGKTEGLADLGHSEIQGCGECVQSDLVL
jgi:hypothetical protein